ncbi:hypothetical protein DICPUDRAFT_95550 [Dictyostelium purpureum]|uniref:NADH dehydrogenase [ubiquinone] iron-sulfur protein 5 n=1 Tax=Dictyostelium purpureum TaxID=5786 RepID=F0ZXR3_DICPU|nr:uncharacterized protein DICPUDRAFT_95550 [Dictyostelium purpureum]EGC31271.1 hypothetical protein DICPUDRAFT_95550 [Dictyostelium purpureum]|eukprot:XP_003292216.1 hypothetical protein DICPUDRAFT_95550 [Dictyostelium purpureum]
MSSGFGAWGGSGTCYPIWSDFCTCVFDKPIEICEPYRRDYQECLNNTKEYKSQKSADYGKGADERLAKVREAMKKVEDYEPKVGKSE